jgi:hypothetical protein
MWGWMSSRRGPIEIEKLGLRYYGAGRKYFWPSAFLVLLIGVAYVLYA